MKRLNRYTLTALLATALTPAVVSCSDEPKEGEQFSTRHERNFIKEGNRNYDRKEFQQAEVNYSKALAENGGSDVARFNLASALAHQEGEQARAYSDSIFNDLSQGANLDASQRSFYNLGNRAYNSEDYQGSIERYKDALRRNPGDDNARENLRLAQLKLREQQNQDQNQDQDKQDQQDQQQEQDKQQQEQNQQNQDKQDEQNQDQQQDQQDQNQDQQQGNKRPDQQDRKDDKEQQQQGGMSQANAEQILKAMENEENATRRRVEAQQKAERERASKRRTTDKPW